MFALHSNKVSTVREGRCRLAGAGVHICDATGTMRIKLQVGPGLRGTGCCDIPLGVIGPAWDRLLSSPPRRIITALWPTARKTKCAALYVHPYVNETCGLKPLVEGPRLDGQHTVSDVDESHAPAPVAIRPREYTSAPKHSADLL